jgi:hypothetical protein
LGVGRGATTPHRKKQIRYEKLTQSTGNQILHRTFGMINKSLLGLFMFFLMLIAGFEHSHTEISVIL